MSEPLVIKDAIVATSDYVFNGVVKTRLVPGGETGTRLSRGMVKLTDQHSDRGARPTTIGKVTGLRHNDADNTFRSDIEVPVTRTTEGFREDYAAGLVGDTFSIGAEPIVARSAGRDPDGTLKIDIVKYETFEIVSTPTPQDGRVMNFYDGVGRGGRFEHEDVTIEVTEDFVDYPTLIQRAKSSQEVKTMEPEVQEQVQTQAASGPSVEDALARFAEAHETELKEQRAKYNALEAKVEASETRNRYVQRAMEAGYDFSQAGSETDKALANGESEADFAVRVTRAKMESVQVNPKPMLTIARGGARHVNAGAYTMALINRSMGLAEDPRHGACYEIAEAHREHNLPNDPSARESLWIPGGVLRAAEVRRAILISDTPDITERFIDMEDFTGWFVDKNRWLDMATVKPAVMGQEFILPQPDRSNAPAAAVVTEGGTFTESNPDIDSKILRPKIIGSLFTISHANLLSTSVNLEMVFEEQYGNFAFQTVGQQLLQGDTSSNQSQNIDGIYTLLGGTGANSRNYGAAQSNFDKDDASALQALVLADKAYGTNEGWVLSPTFKALAQSTQLATNYPKYVFEQTTDIYEGTMWPSGRAIVAPNLTQDTDASIYGFWERMVVVMWGGSLQLVTFDPPNMPVRQYSVRAYVNMGVSNIDAFARMKQGA